MEYKLYKDIRNTNGALLLSKGTIVSDISLSKLESLQKRGVIDTTINLDLCRQLQPFNKTPEHMHALFPQLNNKKYNLAATVSQDVIFDSKKKPWWILINTLSNNLGWLYTHSINVSLISVLIANTLQLDDQYTKEIALGALLHDIGTIVMPKRIMQKEDALTTDEYAIIQQHCELGVNLIQEHHLNHTVKDIVLHHHERCDGSGYPQSLCHEQLPLHSQIVLVADTIDAITSYRPYKEARDMTFALSEFEREPEKYPQEIIAMIFASHLFIENCQ